MTSQRKTLDIGNKLVRGSVSAKIEKSIYILGNKGELLEFKTEEFNVVSRTSFPESSNRYGIFFTRDNKIFTLSKDLIWYSFDHNMKTWKSEGKFNPPFNDVYPSQGMSTLIKEDLYFLVEKSLLKYNFNSKECTVLRSTLDTQPSLLFHDDGFLYAQCGKELWRLDLSKIE